MEWIPLVDAENPIFSVYRTPEAVELQAGCETREDARLISTHKSYEDAYEFCELLAEETYLAIKDLTRDRDSAVE